jgi:type III secretion protein R
MTLPFILADAADGLMAEASPYVSGLGLSDPYTLMLVLLALSLAPFFIMMVTSYLKLVVVLSLIRNALGIQSIPPNIVLNGLAMILSIYVMAPVAQKTYAILEEKKLQGESIYRLKDALYEAREPLQEFLYKHSSPQDRSFFLKSAATLWSQEPSEALKEKDFMVLIPAFTVSELSSAFEIGFLTYLPFIIIDLIISNILLAMGMMMISPTVISLPFKLLLFVLVNGWSRLIQGVILTY